MWHTVGIAVRTALELGLHRESSYSIKPGPELDEAQLVRYRDQELGRRCFWCMIAFDTITSSILGRPLGIRGDDIDTALPLVEIDGLLTPLFTSTVAGMRRIAIFNKIVRYRLFCGKLITSLHRKRSPDISIEDALRLRDELADELDLWYSSLHELRLPHNATLDEDGHSCYLSPTWYEMLYANATLMVWRPCPLLADITNDRHTLQRIYDSATNAINSYAVLHRNRLINYSWVTLHFVFMAGLSYIYAVSRHLRGRINGTQGNACLLEDDPTTIDVVNISRACSNVLVAVAERWNTQRHCHEVFDRLSDAVLNDAIKLQTASVLAQQHDSPSMSLATSANSPVSVPSASTPLQYQQVQHIQHIQQTQEVPRADYINHWNLQMQQQQQNQQQHQQSRHAQPLLPHIHQPALSLPPQQLPQTAAVGHAQLAVDTEFLHSYSDIQTLYHHQRVDNSVMHLTQDWLGYIGAAEPAGGYMTNAHLQPQQHRRPFIPSQQAPYQPPSTRM
ncbi:hypothetical protein LTR02_002274 [Friedmanniomyces endolithicus]|nr:hypothetical protein LTR94_000290 [Friedmanniomyces endolithicus]KAK0785741.1 hypothetical protein LTR75_013421 [Friedmanniomyces endolithicus]KAK0814931.1 hypothetical protein LTR59_000686 [Friedmanniomyces endolithicus]KAK0849259.1 hypothetical protein LTR03_005340 [Friedmanniomyces endolithicus]KAK0874304.1 hypothetical protein LTS02_000220 [Friedmanniomyces endolithicus]